MTLQSLIARAVAGLIICTCIQTTFAQTTATASGATTAPAMADQTTQPQTIIPVPRDDARNNRFHVRHQEIISRIKDGPTELVFIGDSITDQWNSRGRAIWEEAFGQWNPVNMGIGGDRTQNVLWRLNNGEFEGITPRVAVLMIGTNNTNSDEPKDIALGVRRIIETIHERSPDTQVLLLAVFPRKPRQLEDGTQNTTPTLRVKELNKLLPALADGKKVRYLDIGNKFLVDDEIPEEIMPDGLHLSPQGYKIWADAITPTLREMMAEE